MTTEHPMTISMIGLGRMGANLVHRLMRDGHSCVVYDVDADPVGALAKDGASASTSVSDLVEQLAEPRVVWVMVPAGDVTAKTIHELATHMSAGDTLIDGGSSYYRDDVRRADELSDRDVNVSDGGTSGGVWGIDRGYCLMIGGEPVIVERLGPIFPTIAPAMGSATRTPGRTGEAGDGENGYRHCGPHDAGHFVKMVHNGIEYGMMAALAEGLNVLRNADADTRSTTGPADAETAPMEDPKFCQFDIDTTAVTEVWRRGSVIESWLLDLTAAALFAHPVSRRTRAGSPVPGTVAGPSGRQSRKACRPRPAQGVRRARREKVTPR